LGLNKIVVNFLKQGIFFLTFLDSWYFYYEKLKALTLSNPRTV